MPVHFFTEDIPFKLAHPRKTSRWITEAIKKEKKELDTLNYIFCSDNYLLTINQEYLNHQTFTDIITFDYTEIPGQIKGDIFISIDRIRENSLKFHTAFEDELHRVIIHGVLHLLGYKDKTSEEKTLMRKKEDAYLSLRGV